MTPQNPTITVICAKYMITFRIYYLLNILSEGEENFKMSSRLKKWEQFYERVFNSGSVLQLREDIEKPYNFTTKF